MTVEYEQWCQATEVPEEALASLHRGVMEEVRRPMRRWPWAAMAAGVAIFAITALQWEGPEVQTMALVAPAAPPAPVLRQSRTPSPQSAKRRPQAASVIRIETPDPDVVILLVGSEGGSE